MESTISFDLVSPEKLIYNDNVGMIIVPGKEGDLGVLPGHSKLLSSLRPGRVMIYDKSKNHIKSFFVSTGFVEINPGKCIVLAEEVEEMSTMDKAKIEQQIRDLENETLELVRRDTLEKQNVSIVDIEQMVIDILKTMQNDLFVNAKSFQEKNTFMVDDIDEFKEKINIGGFVLAHWDGSSETEDEIKKITKATIRCIPLSSKKEEGKCVLTGKPSNQRVIFAKSY